MLGSLVAAFLSGEASNIAQRTRRAAVAYIAAGLVGLTGVGFLVGAAYLAAARRFGAVEAATGFGVGFLLIAILVVGIHKLRARAGSGSADRRRSADMVTIAAAAAVSLLPSLLRGRAGIAAIVWPILAVLAHAIYRENTGTEGDEPPE